MCVSNLAGSPKMLKEELPVPRKTLIKAGWCSIPLYLDE